MKKFSITLSVAVLVLLSVSCTKTILSLFPGFDIKVPDMQVTIPAIPVVPTQEVDLGSFSMHFNLDSTIKANTGNVFSIGSVGSMKISQVLVTLANGNTLNNLSNFESVRILISSSYNATETEMVNLNFPTTEAYTYTSSPTNAPDILSYYYGTEIRYRILGKLRKPTTTSLNLTMGVTVRVN